MGVLVCDRKECEHIMCDIYIDGVGYICNDCIKEFKKYLADYGKNCQTEGEIKLELKKFMETPFGTYDKGRNMTVEEFFNQFKR